MVTEAPPTHTNRMNYTMMMKDKIKDKIIKRGEKTTKRGYKNAK